MSEQDGTQEIVLERPANDDWVGWKLYWGLGGQEWRTEPEIDLEKKKYLLHHYAINPDEGQGIYPFKDIHLNRADVEWILEFHNSRSMAIDGSDKRKLNRLDLRGVDLIKENLSHLPLASCDLSEAQLQGANLSEAQLQDADLSNAQLQGAMLVSAQLHVANLTNANLRQASLFASQLQGANLTAARLQGANLGEAQLQGANLGAAKLQGANLREAQLQGVKLSNVALVYADHIGPKLADVQWGDTNLAVIDWSRIATLGDEYETLRELDNLEYDTVSSLRILDYKTATRAYRQLSVALRNQGLNEDAARFAYRAQLMQRKVFRYQGKIWQYLFSSFLDLLSGYGYKVGRCFIAYALVIGVFATIYHLLGTHPAWNESIVISMTAFHGRGFFPEQFHPGDPQALAAAIEAFVGLLIEITLIGPK